MQQGENTKNQQLTTQLTSQPVTQQTMEPAVQLTQDGTQENGIPEFSTPPRVVRIDSASLDESYSPPAATPVAPLPAPRPVTTIIREVRNGQIWEDGNALMSDGEPSALPSEPESQSLMSDADLLTSDLVTSDIEQSTQGRHVMTSEPETHGMTSEPGVETTDLEMGRRMSSEGDPRPGGLVVTALSGPDKDLAATAPPATGIFTAWLTQSFGGRSVLDVLPTLSRITGKADQHKQEQAAENQDSGGETGPRKVEDAISYVNEIKTTYQSSPRTFNRFLCLLRDFKLSKISLDNIMGEIKELFKENTHLIKGFDQFLPANKRAKSPPAEVQLEGEQVTPADMFCLMFYGHKSPSLPLLQAKPPTIGKYDYPDIEKSYATRSRSVWGTEANLNKGYSDSEEDEYWKSLDYPLQRRPGRLPAFGKRKTLKTLKTLATPSKTSSASSNIKKKYISKARIQPPDYWNGVKLTEGQKITWAATQENIKRGRIRRMKREQEKEEQRQIRQLQKQKQKEAKEKLRQEQISKSKGAQKGLKPKKRRGRPPKPKLLRTKDPESDQDTEVDVEADDMADHATTEPDHETTESFLGVPPGSKTACQESNERSEDVEGERERQNTLMTDSDPHHTLLEPSCVRTSGSDTVEFTEVEQESEELEGSEDMKERHKTAVTEARTKVAVSVAEANSDDDSGDTTDYLCESDLSPGRKIEFKPRRKDSNKDSELKSRDRESNSELKQKDNESKQKYIKTDKKECASVLNESSKSESGSSRDKKTEDSSDSSGENRHKSKGKDTKTIQKISPINNHEELAQKDEEPESLDEQCANIVSNIEVEYKRSLKKEKARKESHQMGKVGKKKKRSRRENVLIHKTFKSGVPYVQHLDASTPLTNLVSLDQVTVEDFHVEVLDPENLPQNAEAGGSQHAAGTSCGVSANSLMLLQTKGVSGLAGLSALTQGTPAYQFSGIVRNSSDMDTSESSTLISESDESHPSSSPIQPSTSGTGNVSVIEEEPEEPERYSESEKEDEEELDYETFSSDDNAWDDDDDDDDYMPYGASGSHQPKRPQSGYRGRGGGGNRGTGSGRGQPSNKSGKNGSGYGQQVSSNGKDRPVKKQQNFQARSTVKSCVPKPMVALASTSNVVKAKTVHPIKGKKRPERKERVNYKELISAPFASFADLPPIEQLISSCGNKEEICIEMMYKTDRSGGGISGGEEDDDCQEGSGSGTEVEEQEEVYEVDETTGQLVLQQRTITKTSSHGSGHPTIIAIQHPQSGVSPDPIQPQEICKTAIADENSANSRTNDGNRSSSPASASWKTKQDIALGAQSPRVCGHSLFKVPATPPSEHLVLGTSNLGMVHKDLVTGHKQRPETVHFRCSLCLESFPNRSDLVHHNRNRHVSLSVAADHLIECKLCGAKLADADVAVRHMSAHAHGKLACPQCPVRCPDSKSLDNHIHKHAKVAGYQTDQNKNLLLPATAK